MLRPFFAAALDFLFPPLCHVCRTFIPDAGPLHICSICRERLPPIASPLCVVCGFPFIGVGEDHTCGKCITSHHHFDAARAALVHEAASRDLIHAFKYRNKTHLRRPLALLTIERLTEFVRLRAPDLIIPVPLHRKRLRSRGFNQAVLLGEIFSSHWGIPLDRHNLRRIRWTEPQVNLSARNRRANVKGAFSIQNAGLVYGRRVLLVDDVLTTGSTVEECAQMLKSVGAVDVTVITVARALV
ncbi:MAG: ComF family protein [Verrucomicrobia bacterium]|nr:ComF family protein [Deltaproteobacteria bacterium]